MCCQVFVDNLNVKCELSPFMFFTLGQSIKLSILQIYYPLNFLVKFQKY